MQAGEGGNDPRTPESGGECGVSRIHIWGQGGDRSVWEVAGLPVNGSALSGGGAGAKAVPPEGGNADQEDRRLKEACRELEAVFWQLLLRSMRKTIPEGGLLGRSSEEEIYRDLLDEQYALLLAGQDKAGIGRMLYEQLRGK